MSVSQTTHTRTTTAFFDTLAAAEKAKGDLIANGIASSQISIAQDNDATPGDAYGYTHPLADPLMPEEDRYSYAEGLRRGGFLLSVRTDEVHYHRVLELLDREGAVDMSERESGWAREGWRRSPGEVTRVATSASDVPVGGSRHGAEGYRRGSGEVTSMATDPTDVAVGAARFGQRDVGHGRARLRSYAPVAGAGTARHIVEHMDVLDSAGERIGTVDHLEGADKIKLAKHTSPDGRHHYIPLAWVDHVDSHVHLNKSASAARSGW